MVTILITGGAGFLGHHLCKRLIENNKVIVVDNLITGSESNILDHKNYSFYKFCIVKNNLNEFKNIDFIFNLACPASPMHYQKWSLETLDNCYLGVKNILNFSQKNKIPVLHTSTSEIYGDPEISPQHEEYKGAVNCYGRRSCYDEGKRAAEALIFEHIRLYNQRIHIARIFNTYGPNMSIEDGRIVSNFIVQALKGQPITVYGKGNQSRSLCWVEDTIDGLLALSKSKNFTPINIGNDKEYSVLNIANLIKELTNSKSEIVFKPLPDDDPLQRRPDLTKAKKELNWYPKVPLKKGLLETIEYFKQHI